MSQQTNEWSPEVFFGTITRDGVKEHPEPADTSVPVFLVVEISTARFYSEAKYLPSANHQRDFINTMYKWTADTIYLVADGSGDIFCVAFGPPFRIPMLFGKLCEDCEIFKVCSKAFGSVICG